MYYMALNGRMSVNDGLEGMIEGNQVKLNVDVGKIKPRTSLIQNRNTSNSTATFGEVCQL
jgi:hypothetical protein